MLTVTLESLLGTALDHRAGFLVSLLDGETDLETLIDICGMPAKEALAVLDGLVDRGYVRWRRP